MNNQLIEKIITTNNLQCPEFAFGNPLLDKNVAKALSKSFVSILNLQNSAINNNMRLIILKNIRKMCQIEPENHMRVDENVTSLLSEVYKQNMKDTAVEPHNSINKKLDAFLIQNMIDMDIESSFKPSINPEILQALINLNENGIYLDCLIKDTIHWDCSDSKNVQILKTLWSNGNSLSEDISVKLTSDIEKLLLDTCQNILNGKELNMETMFTSNVALRNLVTKSAESPSCFQICCSILNDVFVKTNFCLALSSLIRLFILGVKQDCNHKTFSVLYPADLGHIVVLLDIETEELFKTASSSCYIKSTLEYLSELHVESEHDLIMLLSHFPNWFDIYFNSI